MADTVENSSINNLIAISSVNEIEYIDYNDIIRCQAEGKYTSCIIQSREYPLLSSKNLGDFEKALKNKGFIRTHHSHLINTRFIRKLSKKDAMITLSNGDVVPLSQWRKESFFLYMQKL